MHTCVSSPKTMTKTLVTVLHHWRALASYSFVKSNTSSFSHLIWHTKKNKPLIWLIRVQADNGIIILVICDDGFWHVVLIQNTKRTKLWSTGTIWPQVSLFLQYKQHKYSNTYNTTNARMSCWYFGTLKNKDCFNLRKLLWLHLLQ